MPTGHLWYGLNESLMAVAFDVTESKVVGRPITLMRSVASSGTSGVVQASISRDGTLAYAAGLSDTDERTLVWVDRKGQSQAIPAEPRGYSFPRLSPDGKKIAVSTVYPTADVLVYDIPRAAFTRLTFDGNNVRFRLDTRRHSSDVLI